MLSQQLTMQCPAGHRCFGSPLWRTYQRPCVLHKALVSSSAAEVAKRRTKSPSTLKVVESLGATVAPLKNTDHGGTNKFYEVYILGKHIGSGAYGQVQLVVQRATGQCAAVKLLPKVRGKLSKEKTMKKIRKEVELMGSIQDCGNVIGLHGVYEDDAQVYLVMELCSGGDLERVLEAKCIVHGDVKPANFMLRQRFRDPLRALERGAAQGDWLKAVDFGCSQSYRNKASLSRRTGTPVYMAPEVFKRDYLQASDMWSLGMMMYQLLTGRFPFWDTLEQCRAHGIDEVMRATIMDPIPINYGPWLTMSEEGLSFLQSLMLRNPAQRLSAAQALEHPWFATQFEEAGLSVSSGQQVLRSNASEAGDNISATDEKLDHRNNIVPMPQQQHQQLQSHSSLHCKPSVHSM
ncbi:TPA: hypothetical protein ACH3X3_007794 [Trebouxia sp. C0006]